MTRGGADQSSDVGPEDIPAPGWRAVLRRTVKEFQNDNLTDSAAALTYYAVLALFPALIVLVALVGLFGQYPQTTDHLLHILNDIGVPTKTTQSLRGTIDNVITKKGGAGALLGVLYYAAPNARLPRFQWLSPGAVVALVGWVVVSFAFFQYAKHFGSYDKTYGALGAAITLLVWMWLTNVAILFGQELNAEIERGRELAAGEPALEHIQLPLRSTPKHDREQQAAHNSREVIEGSGNGG